MRLKVLFLFLIPYTVTMAQEIKINSVEISMRDLAASVNPRYDNNEKPGGLIKVQFPHEGATFESSMILGDITFKEGEYWVYLASGTKRLTVKYPKCLPVTVEFGDYGISSIESKTTYVIQVILLQEKTSKFKPKTIYLEPKVRIGQMMSVGASLGGYYRHFNAELNYLFGLTNSEEVYWNTSEGGEPFSYTYKPSYFGGKIGYAFYIGKPFRITPQIGLGSVQISGTEKQTSSNQVVASKGYALNASISARVDYLILPWLGVGISPQYSFALKKSDLYNRVSEVSSKVKGFANGFNVDVNLFITF